MITVQDILNRKGSKVVTVEVGDSVLEAARKMKEARIGAVVVCGGEESVAGIFTERDLLQRVVTEGKSAKDTPVRDVMTSPVAAARLSTSLKECRRVMTEKRLRHLPVVEEGKLVGIVSSGDLIASEVEAQQSTIEYLHGYLHGRM